MFSLTQKPVHRMETHRLSSKGDYADSLLGPKRTNHYFLKKRCNCQVIE